MSEIYASTDLVAQSVAEKHIQQVVRNYKRRRKTCRARDNGKPDVWQGVTEAELSLTCNDQLPAFLI